MYKIPLMIPHRHDPCRPSRTYAAWLLVLTALLTIGVVWGMNELTFWKQELMQTQKAIQQNESREHERVEGLLATLQALQQTVDTQTLAIDHLRKIMPTKNAQF